jgi:hypothetical protein
MATQIPAPLLAGAMLPTAIRSIEMGGKSDERSNIFRRHGRVALCGSSGLAHLHRRCQGVD